MKKVMKSLERYLKPHGLAVENSLGHGAHVIDLRTDRKVANVHLQQDGDVDGAIALLRRRGYDIPKRGEGS